MRVYKNKGIYHIKEVTQFKIKLIMFQINNTCRLQAIVVTFKLEAVVTALGVLYRK